MRPGPSTLKRRGFDGPTTELRAGAEWTVMRNSGRNVSAGPDLTSGRPRWLRRAARSAGRRLRDVMK
jgi:hypothetical protein